MSVHKQEEEIGVLGDTVNDLISMLDSVAGQEDFPSPPKPDRKNELIHVDKTLVGLAARIWANTDKIRDIRLRLNDFIGRLEL